ncbi:MAG TPA: type VI secretion system protein TssA [Vicinamibacterales bacterium]
MTALMVGQDLLQPIAPDRPCGDDLEDTQLLASFDAFRVFGQSAPHDPPPEWSAIASRATEALCKSKDLRLLAYLGSALLRTDGLPAFADTLNIASQWLDVYWRDTYPRIDEDAILRRSALNCFADQMAVIDALRRLPLASSRQHGTFSLRDIEIASGQLPGDGDVRLDEARVNAAFAAMSRGDVTRLQDATGQALAAVKRIDVKMREERGPDAAPGFDPLSLQLAKIDKVLRTQLGLRTDGDAPGPEGSDGGPQANEPAPLGRISSRQDAIRALDAVSEFFRQHEPSSPIPLILDRAKRLVSKNFLEVLAEIAPDAVPQARLAGGLKDS